MFKQVKIVVWAAFLCWMAFFLFSLNQAEAQTPAPAGQSDVQTFQNQLKLYKSELCGITEVFDQKGSKMPGKCHDSSEPTISGTVVSTAEEKSLFLQQTIDLCSTPSDPQARERCWEAADARLSGTVVPYGRHDTCNVKKIQLWSTEDSCMSQAFRNDLATWSKPIDKNESALRDFARALCHKVNGESDSDNLYWGLLADHSSDCDKSATAMIDDSVKNHQIPTNDLQLKGYEAHLSVQVCNAQNDSEPVQFMKWAGLEGKNPAPQRLACFQAADSVYGGVPKSVLPENCKQEQLSMAVPSTVVLRDAFSLTNKSREAYLAKFTPGADCYQQIFTQAAEAANEAGEASNIQNQVVKNQEDVLKKIGWHDKVRKEF